LDASEIITALVAAYAAVVSTTALVLLRRDKRQRETTRCEVEVGLYDVADPVIGKSTSQAVNVNLINHSEHPVRWTRLAFHKQGGGPDEWLLPAAYLLPPLLPLTVASRDTEAVMLDRGKLEEAGIDWSRPVVVQASLSTGERFYSAKVPLTPKP
jgi:hypothetical protein